MSAELEIPAAAYTAAADAIDRYAAEHHGQRVVLPQLRPALLVSAAAPIVVAAELRRMADRIGPRSGVVDGSDSMTRRACAADLRARADELAPAAPDDAAEVDADELNRLRAELAENVGAMNLLRRQRDMSEDVVHDAEIKLAKVQSECDRLREVEEIFQEWQARSAVYECPCPCGLRVAVRIPATEDYDRLRRIEDAARAFDSRISGSIHPRSPAVLNLRSALAGSQPPARDPGSSSPSLRGGAWGAAMDAAVRARDEWRAAEAGPMAGHPDDPECFAIAEAVLAVVRSADPAKAVPAGMMPCSRMAARCSQCDAIEHVDTGGRLVEHDAEGRRCCGSGTDDFERSHGSTAGAGTPEVQA